MPPSTTDTPPKPAYFPTSPLSPLHPPSTLYSHLRSLPPSSLHPTHTHLIPPRSAHAFLVPAGSLFRLSTPQGAQVGDLNVWNASDAREKFWAARTRQLQSSHLRVGDRLWSCLPFLRPLCGVVEDGCLLGERKAEGIEGEGEGEGEGEAKERTKWGGRCHDLLGTRCDPYGKQFYPFYSPPPPPLFLLCV